jgi:hypothetical protein
MREGNLVLRYLRLCNLDQGDSVPIGAILDFGEAEGYDSFEIQDHLVRAGSMGWIVAIDLQIHLTKYGYTISYPANDNADRDG